MSNKHEREKMMMNAADRCEFARRGCRIADENLTNALALLTSHWWACDEAGQKFEDCYEEAESGRSKAERIGKILDLVREIEKQLRVF